ncbi:MAG: glycosyltransferase [Flavobacteriaceae bacterium]|jgi:glycosyltransferase involved in cell wall biosynthesis|nr:glycosyltransferase [Flavobacteriaceae bacterium]
MKFSILTANFNNGKYFKDCFKSIVNQTYQDFEVIIVDDCSTDDSIRQIESLITSDERFKLYKNEKNFGAGYTKKKCADLASGDILCYLDPDDALMSEALDICMETYKKHPDSVATHSQLYACDENLNKIQIFKRAKAVPFNDKYFFNIDNRVMHLFTFKSDIYKKIHLDENLLKAVDQDLYLRIYELGKFSFIKKPIYLYRIHKQGISQGSEKKEKLYEENNKVLLQTIRRRNIRKIGNALITKDNENNLYEIISYQQSRFFYRLKNKILNFQPINAIFRRKNKG